MPQVPYNPIPTADPSQGGPGAVSVHAPPAAFGENIGRALEGLGKDEAHAGNELFQRAIQLQTLQNETVAKEADAKYMETVGRLRAEFGTRQGVNAGPAALEKHIGDLQAARQQLRADLPTDQARKFYDASSLGFMGREIFNSAGHSATQTRAAAVSASQARVNQAEQHIFENPTDQAGYDSLTGMIDSEVRRVGAMAGWPKEKIEDQVSQQTSRNLSMRVAGLAKRDPFAARDILEANKDKFRAQDYERVSATVQSQMNGVGARNIAEGVLAPLKDGSETMSLNDAVKQGVEEAKEKFPELQDLPGHVEQQIIAKYNRIKAGDRDFQNANIDTIYGALNGAFQNKNIPTNVDELRAIDPKVSAAYDSLHEKQKAQVRDALVTLSKQGMKVDTTTSLRTKDALIGLAQNNPEGFMDVDLFSKDLSINDSDRKGLVDMRRKMSASPSTDPHVTRSMRWIREKFGGDMKELGIFDRVKGQEDDYDRFTGGLWAAIQAFQTEKNRAPNYKEVTEQIAPQLLAHESSSWWPWSWKTETPPVYRSEVPEAFSEGVKKKYAQENDGRTPTDEQIRLEYIRTTFRKLYRKESK